MTLKKGLPGLYRFSFLFFLLSIFSVEKSQAEEVYYYCRGEVVVLAEDPLSVALKTTTRASSFNKSLLPKETQILYEDSKDGILAIQFPDPQTLNQFVSQKTEPTKSFPVYRYPSDQSPVIVLDEVTLAFRYTPDQATLNYFGDNNGLEVLQQSPTDPRMVLFRIKSKHWSSPFICANSLRFNSDLLWAEPNFRGGRKLHTPNDPFYANQRHHDLIQSLGAWDRTLGITSITVAVLDEGVQIDHPDLAANIWQNPNEIQDGMDNDGNGLIDDINGWDYTDNNGDLTPDNSIYGAHGTAVAGLIAAIQNNALGVTGVAPMIKILNCRIANSASVINSDFVLANAIRYAALHADVLNNSWGGANPSNTLMDAIDFALSNGRNGKGSPVFFAAGNGYGQPVDFPANYLWSVSVGESDLSDVRHEESNFDKRLCLVGPQGNWTTDLTGAGRGLDTYPGEISPDPDYTGVFGGTSSSTPIVSGAAALILSINPSLKATQVVQTLFACLDNPGPDGPGYDVYGKTVTMGYGRLNLVRAVHITNQQIDDRLEPNDSISVAARLTTGFYPWLYLAADHDFYRIDAVQDAPINCVVHSSLVLGDVGVDLLDSNGTLLYTPVPSTAGNNRIRTISFTPSSSGPYYLKIYPLTGENIPYCMDARIGITDDGYENNDSLANAAAIYPGSGTTIKNLVYNDDDFYLVSMSAGQWLYCLMTFQQHNGNLDLHLLDSNGNILISSQTTTNGEDIGAYQAVADGDYILKITAPPGVVQNEYALHVAILNSPPITNGGQDDVYEENDTVATATELSAGFYPRMAIASVGGEVRDVIRFNIPARKIPRVTISFSIPIDLDLRIYDSRVVLDPPNTPPLAQSRRNDAFIEMVSIPPKQEATTYWVDIFRMGNGSTPYRLAIEYLDPAPLPNADNWQSFWRLNEGMVGAPYNPDQIRDWRGPIFYHAPMSYLTPGPWREGPSSDHFPGSDGLALDCTNGGMVLPTGTELFSNDSSFTLWMRLKPNDSNQKRLLAGIPGEMEWFLEPNNQINVVVGSLPGQPLFPSGSLMVQAGIWQDLALVWNRTANRAKILLFDGEKRTLEADISGYSFTPNQPFYISHAPGYSTGAGMVEQIRFYKGPLNDDDVAKFSNGFIPSLHDQWSLYQ